MANLLAVAQQTTKKVTFPKIKETDKSCRYREKVLYLLCEYS